MARATGKMITSEDAAFMITNEGFTGQVPNPSSKVCLTKQMIENFFNNVDTGFSDFQSYATNELVPYDKINNIIYDPNDSNSPLDSTDPDNDEDITMAVFAYILFDPNFSQDELTVEVSYGKPNFTYNLSSGFNSSTSSRTLKRLLGSSYSEFDLTVTDDNNEIYNQTFPASNSSSTTNPPTIYSHSVVYSDSPYDICSSDKVSENSNLSLLTIESTGPSITYTEKSYSLQNNSPAPTGFYRMQGVFGKDILAVGSILVISDNNDQFIATCS